MIFDLIQFDFDLIHYVVARWIGNSFNDGLYDIHIHLNCVPILESDSLVGPWEQSRAHTLMVAKDIMSPVTRSLCLLQKETVRSVTTLLETTRHSTIAIFSSPFCSRFADAFFLKTSMVADAFPVVEESGSGLTLIALVTRRQLCLILANGCFGPRQASFSASRIAVR